MGVYNDMANDAGYYYGTPENRQMADWLLEQQWNEYQEQLAEQDYERYLEQEIYPWFEWWEKLGKIN